MMHRAAGANRTTVSLLLAYTKLISLSYPVDCCLPRCGCCCLPPPPPPPPWAAAAPEPRTWIDIGRPGRVNKFAQWTCLLNNLYSAPNHPKALHYTASQLAGHQCFYHKWWYQCPRSDHSCHNEPLLWQVDQILKKVPITIESSKHIEYNSTNIQLTLRSASETP